MTRTGNVTRAQRLKRRRNRHRRTSLVAFLTALIVFATAGTALAFWASTTNIGATGNAGNLSAPTLPTTSAITTSSITIGWTNPSSQLAGASYKVTRTSGPGSPFVVCTVTHVSGTHSCPDTGLNANQLYGYSIIALLNNWQTTPITTSATTTASLASPTVTAVGPSTGTAGTAIAASAISSVLAGGSTSPAATGTTTYRVFGPQTTAPSTCTSGGTLVGTAVVSGNNTYNPNVGFTPTAGGDYWWYASYSGDANNNPATSTCGSGMSETAVNNTVTATTAGTYTLSVPAGVTSFTFTMNGAGGGGGDSGDSGANGGSGGTVSGTITIPLSGSTTNFAVVVGGGGGGTSGSSGGTGGTSASGVGCAPGGTGGANSGAGGGGGGGATCIYLQGAPAGTIVAVGGGGGGAGGGTAGVGGGGGGGPTSNPSATGNNGNSGVAGSAGGGGGGKTVTTNPNPPYAIGNTVGAAGSAGFLGSAGNPGGSCISGTCGAGGTGAGGFLNGDGGGGGGGMASGGGGGSAGAAPGGGGGGGSAYTGGTASDLVSNISASNGTNGSGGAAGLFGAPGSVSFTGAGVGIFGTATKLVFTQPPAGATGGTAFATQPTVAVEDAAGNLVTSDSSAVTLAITSGTPTSGGPGTLSGCSGTETSGVVTFAGCKIDKVGTGYKLHATDASLTVADSTVFNVTAGPAAQLVFTTSPAGANGGVAFGTQPTVTIEDAAGNTVADSSAVTLTIGTNPSAGTLSGCSETTTAGVATFSGCKLDKAGNGYTLTATDPADGLNTASAPSSAFNVPVPTTSSINLTGTSPTNASSVQFTVTFGTTVTGVSTSNFNLTTTGVSGTSVTSVTAGPSATYTVTVNSGSGSGTIRLNLNSGSGIADLGGNALGGTIPFTTGQTYTIDKTPPAGTNIASSNGNSLHALRSSDTVTYTFSEAMNPASIAAGLTAGGSVSNITATLANGATDDTLTVANVGQIDLGSGSYTAGTINYTTSTLQLSADGKTLILTLGGGSTSSTGPSTSTLKWTPGSLLADLAGNPINAAQVTQSPAGQSNF